MMYFKTNLPGWERAIRIAMGVMLAALAYMYAAAPWTWVGNRCRRHDDRHRLYRILPDVRHGGAQVQ